MPLKSLNQKNKQKTLEKKNFRTLLWMGGRHQRGSRSACQKPKGMNRSPGKSQQWCPQTSEQTRPKKSDVKRRSLYTESEQSSATGLPLYRSSNTWRNNRRISDRTASKPESSVPPVVEINILLVPAKAKMDPPADTSYPDLKLIMPNYHVLTELLVALLPRYLKS